MLFFQSNNILGMGENERKTRVCHRFFDSLQIESLSTKEKVVYPFTSPSRPWTVQQSDELVKVNSKMNNA